MIINQILKKQSLYFIIAFLLLGYQYSYGQIITADISKAEVSFVFTHKNVKGTISDIQGVFELNENQPEASKIKGTTAINTLKTGNFIRNSHLMAKKYFYAKMYPKISFEGTVITKTTNGYLARGILTIKKVSKEVSILFKKQEGYFLGKLNINSADYGISVYKDKDRNKVTVNFKFPISS